MDPLMQNEQRISPHSPELVVGIVGAGVMGRGIAQIAALAGARVCLLDGHLGAAEAARAILLSTLDHLVVRNRLSPADASLAGARIICCSGFDELASCHVVIEAIIEDLAAKKTLFGKLEEVVAVDTILATNTSSLAVTAIAAGLRHPERLAGFHFFNPVPLMKVVEVIPGLVTDTAITQFLLELGRHWGHAAVQAKDTPGFIVNHAGRGYGTEGMRLLAEGITTIATLDDILRDCAGFKLGPCELMDLTGLDVSHPVMESIYEQYYHEPRFRPQGLTRQMLSAGALGKKTGHGFYRYDAQGKKIASALLVDGAAERAAAQLPSSIWISSTRPELASRIALLLKDSGVEIESGERPGANALCIVTPLGDDATTCCVAEELDASRTVGVETLFELGRRRVVMTTPATSAACLATARTLFAHDGAAVSVIRDSTGLVAQRVVAHIINIACDMAQQEIADPCDIDRAVTLGLGYPHGPLAWGDLLGASTVLAILDNLLQHSGDPRYRASPWLRRRAALALSLHHKEV